MINMRFSSNCRVFHHSHRYFTDQQRYPINIVLGPLLPKSITKTRPFQKLWKKTQFKPIEVDETSLDNHAEIINNPNPTFHVGYFDQYPTRSNQNCAVFTEKFMPTYRMSKKQWRCNTEDSNINIKFPIDAYPFNYTYKKSKNKSLWKTDKNITLKSVGIVSKIEDCVDDNLPILVRKLHKNRKQKLICWRDQHPDIKNISRIETLINEYKPDLIVLEYPITNDCLKLYHSAWYKYLIHPYLRFIQRFIPKQLEISFGDALGKIIRLVCGSNLPIAYATNSAIMLGIKNKIDICLADYPEQLSSLMSYMVKILDSYQTLIYGVNTKRLTQLDRNRDLPEKLMNLLSTRMAPHLLSIGDLRNDLMALAINESIENDVDKILFIVGGMHWLDICDKLCGKAQIINPFKEMTQEHLILKSHNPLHYTGHSKVVLNAEEIERYINVVGIRCVAMLMIEQKNYQTSNEIENALNEWITNWNASKCKLSSI